MRLVLSLLAVAGTCASATAYTYTQDFEGLNVGLLNGQGGWTASANPAGFAPLVVDLGGNRAARLEVTDIMGANSEMTLVTGDLIAMGATHIAVGFDILRPTLNVPLNQNLWWLWVDSGSPTYGLQWDQMGGVTMPHGFGNNNIPTLFDQFVRVEMVWDMTTGIAKSWYADTLVDAAVPISGITTLTAWTNQLVHDADTGTGAGVAYIDNFEIRAVPEPTSLMALGLGVLVLFRRRS